MVEYIVYRLAQFVVLLIPLRLVYRVGRGIAYLGYFFWRGSREILKENLRNVFSDWPEWKITECARLNFIQFSRFIADFFYISRLNAENVNRFIVVENKRYLEQVSSHKRGVIALTAHLGNWELGGVCLALLGQPISAIALSHAEEKVDAIFVRQRTQKGVKVIPVGKAGMGSYRELIRGRMVAILGDRDVRSQGVVMPFFGKPAVFPRGMPALAVRTGASILIGFTVRDGEGYKLFFEKPYRADLSKAAEESEKEVLRKWIAVLEKYIRLYPEQWFMYHRVWNR